MGMAYVWVFHSLDFMHISDRASELFYPDVSVYGGVSMSQVDAMFY